MNPRFDESIDMAVPLQFAFDFLADPSTASVIDPAVREYRPDTTPMALGTRNHIRFKMWGLPLTVTSLVTAWEPGSRMMLENVKPSRPTRAIATHSFEPADSGCRHTWSMEMVRTGVDGGLLGRLFCRVMRRNARAQKARFKTEVEPRYRSESTGQDRAESHHTAAPVQCAIIPTPRRPRTRSRSGCRR
jgi:Polyketide cyclase / dehydrase and lipid transport